MLEPGRLMTATEGFRCLADAFSCEDDFTYKAVKHEEKNIVHTVNSLVHKTEKISIA